MSHQATIELLNNNSHGLLPHGVFSSLFFDQALLITPSVIYICIDKTVPGFLDVTKILLLDVTIFVV